MLVLVEWRHYTETRGLTGCCVQAAVLRSAMIAATAVGIAYMRKHRLPAWKIADMGAPSIALGEAIGRGAARCRLLLRQADHGPSASRSPILCQ